MLLGILLTILLIISLVLIGIVLLQRSEGGALGMGGGPSGFMTARGAGDLLTRTTWILGMAFFALCLLLTVLGGRERAGSSVVDRLDINSVDPRTLNQPAPAAPVPAQPTAPAANAPLQAPTPAVRNPFLDSADGAPAPAPVPASK